MYLVEEITSGRVRTRFLVAELIGLARDDEPGLRYLVDGLGSYKPLKGKIITCCHKRTPESLKLAGLLSYLGADVKSFGTPDDNFDSLLSPLIKQYCRIRDGALDWYPDLFIDDLGEMGILITPQGSLTLPDSFDQSTDCGKASILKRARLNLLAQGVFDQVENVKGFMSGSNQTPYNSDSQHQISMDHPNLENLYGNDCFGMLLNAKSMPHTSLRNHSRGIGVMRGSKVVACGSGGKERCTDDALKKPGARTSIVQTMITVGLKGLSKENDTGKYKNEAYALPKENAEYVVMLHLQRLCAKLMKGPTSSSCTLAALASQNISVSGKLVY